VVGCGLKHCCCYEFVALLASITALYLLQVAVYLQNSQPQCKLAGNSSDSMQATTNMHVIASVVHAQNVFMRECIISAQGHTLCTRTAFRCDLERMWHPHRSCSRTSTYCIVRLHHCGGSYHGLSVSACAQYSVFKRSGHDWHKSFNKCCTRVVATCQ
jgi:hypothetical protein